MKERTDNEAIRLRRTERSTKLPVHWKIRTLAYLGESEAAPQQAFGKVCL